MKALAALTLLLGHCSAPDTASADRCPEFRQTALDAGWSEADWPRLDAIIWRESRCSATAHNRRGKDDSYGLVQLNMRAHRSWVRPLVDGDFDRLLDPATNLAVARQLFDRAEDA
ncbi:hypothetical protein EBZ38_15250 [bacterium]|nr:hypothetical protein [bacterium]